MKSTTTKKTVTGILEKTLSDQGSRIIDSQQASTRILEALRTKITVDLATAPADSFASYRQQQMLTEFDRLLGNARREVSSEVVSGISESWEMGVELLPKMAGVGSNITLQTFGISRHVVDQVKDFASGKLDYWGKELQNKIRSEIIMGTLGQKTPQDIAARIAGSLTSPGPFENIAERARVITGVEMGRTFSMAHQAGMEDSLETLPKMQKMWLHAGHPKMPRPYHLNLNGDVKPVDEPFLVGNISMMYPRDPKAPVSEIVRCGCMHVAYMAAWGSKKAFLDSWTKAQVAANKPRGDYKG